MKTIGKIVRFIPGFRQMASGSMIIAVTYYGASLLISFKYWYWGLALLALPFLVFYLLDLNSMKGRKLPLIISVAAGIAVLLGTAAALSSGGVPGKATLAAATSSPSAGISAPAAHASASVPASQASTESAAATSAAIIKTTVASSPSSASKAATAAPSQQASHEPDQAQYAYVASKTSKIFHLPGCSSAKRIKPENLTGFKAREEAVKAGLQPCQRCKP